MTTSVQEQPSTERIARDTVWSFIAFGGRAVASLITFLLLTRTLGTAGFGVYSGIQATAAIGMPFATIGALHLIVKNIAGRPDRVSAAWGIGLRSILLGTIAMLGLLLVFGGLILPNVNRSTLTLLAIAEMAGFVFPELIANAYRAIGRFRSAAIVIIGTGVIRAVVVIAIWVGTLPADLMTLGWWFLGTSFAWGLLVAYRLGGLVGRPTRPRGQWSNVVIGLDFAWSQTAQSFQNDVDKTMLVRADLESDAGIYSVGYRLVHYASLPVLSVLSVSYPRFFAEGERGGLAATRRLSRRLVAPIGLYGVLVAGLLVVAAKPLAALTGEGYGEARNVIIAMAAIPFVRGVQSVWGDALTGSGHQRFRSAAIVVAALANVGLNTQFIQRWSWRGAVYATYISDVALLGLIVAGLMYFGRRGDSPSGSGSAGWPDPSTYPDLTENFVD